VEYSQIKGHPWLGVAAVSSKVPEPNIFAILPVPRAKHTVGQFDIADIGERTAHESGRLGLGFSIRGIDVAGDSNKRSLGRTGSKDNRENVTSEFHALLWVDRP
jgi:hypothetical protein